MISPGHEAQMITPETALAGRPAPIATAGAHFLTGRPLKSPLPEGMRGALFAMGCFWGAERLFWPRDGVWLTMVGYAGGFTSNPTYDEVCTGQTGHAETVRLIFDPARIGYGDLLGLFWENHDPTQGMGQGNDRGTQYRSAIYTCGDRQAAEAGASRAAYDARLRKAGFGPVTTEIKPAPAFYFAEAGHQQYLAKNPTGYCGIGGTGVVCPIAAGA